MFIDDPTYKHSDNFSTAGNIVIVSEWPHNEAENFKAGNVNVAKQVEEHK